MSASPYASVSDVAALNFGRGIGVGSNPGPSQIQTYINMVAGEINAVLTQKGYAVPVNTASYPVAGQLLQSVNAKGALAMMEEAAPSSPHVERVKAAYDEAMKLLSDAKFVMDVDIDGPKLEARAPWITFQPTGHTFDPDLANINGAAGDGISAGTCNNPADPFFSRSQRF